MHTAVLRAAECMTLAVDFFARFLGGVALLLLRFVGSSRSGWLKQ